MVGVDVVHFALDLAVPSALSTASFRRSLISQSEIRATVVSGDTRATGHRMKRFLLLPAAVMLGLTSASTVPVRAGGGDVAAGLIGGLAAGTIIGAAVTAPRYYGPAGLCGARAVLLLDARRAGVGWIPGRLDVSRCQSVRVGSSPRRFQSETDRSRYDWRRPCAVCTMAQGAFCTAAEHVGQSARSERILLRAVDGRLAGLRIG
jgi:hypothetical protein